jgi:hypothetical protein
MTGAYIGLEFAGSLKFESATEKGAYTISPNLTPDKETGRIQDEKNNLYIRYALGPIQDNER